MPSLSTSSRVSRSPAVSTILTGIPSRSSAWRTASRVVPGTAVTIASSSPESRLSRLDLPTFGCPASTTCSPRRNIAPCLARENIRSRFACRAARRPRASADSRKSTSSSGKSIFASTSMRKSINSSTRRRISPENSPDSERIADRAAAAVVASMRSATASACARSSLSFKNARRVNSPGSASRAPSCMQRPSRSRRTTGLPCACSSSTSSPVYDAGALYSSAIPVSIALPFSARKCVS